MKHQDSPGHNTPFDHLTALLCSQFGVPFSLVSFIHGELAVFCSQVGLGESAVPRELSACNLLVGMGPGARLVIEDTTLHPVLKDHPLVTGEPFLRFFAGATVSNSKGEAVGAVGIMDSKPRPALTASELVMLDQTAAIAGSMFDQTTAQQGQSEQLKLLKLAEQMSGVGNWRYDVRTGKVTWSDEVYRIHGYAPQEVDPNCDLVLASYHPDDAQRLAEAVSRALATGEGYDFELRLRTPDLEERLVVTQAGTEQDDQGRIVALFGVFQDVTQAIQAKARLERSESLFRVMSETATDVIARYGPDGTFRYLSPSVETVMGRTPGDLIGRNCSEFIHPDDFPQVRASFASCMVASPGAKPLRFEYRALKQDGSVVWLEASPRPVFDLNGDLLEFHDHVRDITTRKEAERVQAELVETLSMAEELGGVGSWRLDVATGAVTWSDEVYRIHGKSRDSFDPSFDDAVSCYHPDDRQTVADCCRQAIETGIGGGFQLRLMREDGETRIVSSQCRPECDETGATVALFGVFQDVTESIRNHDRVAASEARYRLLADRASDIIVTYGVDGRIRYISPSIEAATGVAAEALVGRPVTTLIVPEDVPALTERFRAMVKTPAGIPIEGFRYRGTAYLGEQRWFEARTSLIRDEDGRVVEFQDVVRDITATKALEDQLIAARDVAEAGALTKSEFLANMSHELRTPLTSVIGFSGLLQASANLPEAERRYADRIATASEALLSVINDILDYSKLEAEAVDLDPQAFDPRAMAEGAISIIENQCQAKGLTLETAIDADLPATLMGDEGRLRQVTLNFLSNAVKFTAAGSVRLSMTMSGGRLRVAVTDSGIGVAPDKVDALFDRFTQADASTTRVYGGTGLGLAISQRLIEMMGGEIGVESEPGKGSTFWFEAPLREAAAGADAAEAGELTVSAGLRVLMADDAAPNRELVTAILGSFGLALETVENGAEAVEAARAGAYDLILMDVHMPVMDGLDATRTIRAMGGTVGRTPIIALTANVQPEQVLRCREAGMDGHVGKPIQVAELFAALAAAEAGTAGMAMSA